MIVSNSYFLHPHSCCYCGHVIPAEVGFYSVAGGPKSGDFHTRCFSKHRRETLPPEAEPPSTGTNSDTSKRKKKNKRQSGWKTDAMDHRVDGSFGMGKRR